LRPIARVKATIGVVQKGPIFTPGLANDASSAANRRVIGQLAMSRFTLHFAAASEPIRPKLTAVQSWFLASWAVTDR
jgi:hypothetical protein